MCFCLLTNSLVISSSDIASSLFVFCFQNNADGENEVANKRVEDMALSEEVNGTPQQNKEHHNDDQELGTPAAAQEEEDNDDDADSEDEEEVEHPGEVSIGRKLWTFIST